MKRTALLSIGIACVAASAVAQDEAQAVLRAKDEKKLTAPFLAAGGWGLDYDEARATAAKTGNLIFAYFSRSYAP